MKGGGEEEGEGEVCVGCKVSGDGDRLLSKVFSTPVDDGAAGEVWSRWGEEGEGKGW